MRHAVCLAVLMVLIVSGCPNVPNPLPQFLSADPQGGSRGEFTDGPPVASPDDTAGEGEGGGEREVVEPDIIRQEGDLLYVLNQHRGLMIVNLDTREVLSQTSARGLPRDLYLRDGRAYVLTSQAQNVSVAEGTVSMSGYSSRLTIVDVDDATAPVLQGQFEIPGDLADSSLVGDILYAVTAEYQYYYDDTPEPVKTQLSETTVSSFDLSDPSAVAAVDELAFDGIGQVVRATSSAIYVAQPDWAADTTAITRVDITDPAGVMELGGIATVPGMVADRFKMDEFAGVLRVFSNTGWNSRQTFITTITAADMTALGQTTLDGAAGETLFATRFDGPRAYAVTYLVIDPLFVIDLSDPANPVVSGELKVPGWSTHIQPMGDRLLALGVDDTEGRRASVSLFDVSDPAAPALLDRESFGSDWTWSTAYEDVKALTVIDDLVIVPFGGWDYNQGGYFNRLQFLTFTDTEVNLHGAVEVDGQAVRSFEHDALYFGVTQEQISVIDGSDLDNPEVVDSIMLAENVVDFLPLADGAGVEVVQRWERNEVVLRAVDDSGAAQGSIAIEGAYYHEFLAAGSRVALLSTVWNDNGYATYQARIIDFTDPEAPTAGAPVDLGIMPDYGYWWDRPMPMGGASPGMAEDAISWYPYGYQAGNNAVISGTFLVVSGSVRDGAVFQPAAAIVDTETKDAPRLVTLPFDEAAGVYAEDGQVFAATKRYMSASGAMLPLSAYYLSTLDAASGTVSEPANVPGQYLDYDAASGLLLTQDWQWSTGFEARLELHASAWDGSGAPEISDTIVLPNYGGLIHADTEHVLIQTYNEGAVLSAFSIDDDFEFETGPVLNTANTYPNVRAVDGDTVYLARDGLLQRYTLGSEWVLRDATELSGWVQTVRLTPTEAILPLGYAGVLRLER